MDLPATYTSLIGRESELEQIAKYLDDPEYRLVTLVGPGGIGKTRLGIEAARRYGDLTKDGVSFIDLQAVDSPDMVISALADSLQVSLHDPSTAVKQIAQFLSGKEMLLFFDNFEQVLEAAPQISELLGVSPGTTVLVTSRSPLRLTQEWLLQVDGLPVPQANRPRISTESAAVKLFVDRARKVRPDLAQADDMPDIERICRLTDGMPLAIEIAASWTHMLTCAEIATEISQNRQFLASTMRNIPERHRSIQAIFEQSSQLLNERERNVFNRLSVFKGGFTRDAAEKVAGADLATLSSLVDRSLIRTAQNNRYRIHELVRQFAEDQLMQSEETQRETVEAHCAYFMDFLASLHDDMAGPRQMAGAQEIEKERENVRSAWGHAVDNIYAPQVRNAIVSVGLFIQFSGRYYLGGETFSHAVAVFQQAEQTEEVRKTLALLQVQNGWFSLRQGKFDESEKAFTNSAELHRSLGVRSVRGFGLDPGMGLAYVASARGDLQTVRKHASESLARAIEDGHTQHRGMSYQIVGHLQLREGNLEEARECVLKALDACVEIGDRWFTTYCHNELAEIAMAMGAYDEAIEHIQASLERCREFGDRAGIGLAHVYLGEALTLIGKTDEARQNFADSKEAYQQLGDRGGMARVDGGLGVLAVATGETSTAVKTLSEVLDSSLDMQFVAMTLDVLAGTGELALKCGKPEEGKMLLRYVDSHASTEARTRTRLRSLLKEEDRGDSPNNGSDELGEQVVQARRLLEFAGLATPQSESAQPTPTNGQSTPLLPDPLTEREIEILSLIAQGLPNQQIADDLFVSLGTVKWHSNQIYTKLGVHNRTSAVAMARELGMISAQG